MSLVHDALDRLPERQTLDNGLANPLAPKKPNKTPLKIAWPAVVVVALIIIIGAQAISLYHSRTATQSNQQGADTAVKTPNLSTTIATTVVTTSAIPATAAPDTTREIPKSASNAATSNSAVLPAATAGVVKSPAVVTSQIVSTLIAAPVAKNAPQANSNTAPLPTSPPVVMAEVATNSPIAVTHSETSLPVPTPTVAVFSTVTDTVAENAITTADNRILKGAPSVTVASTDTLSKPTPIDVASNTDSDLAVAQMPAVISDTTVLPSPKANASVSAKNTAETLQYVIRAAADAVNSGNVATAELLLKNAFEADPDSLALTLALARFWIKTADYRSALSVLQNSQDDDAMALRGLVYELQGDVSQAMQLYHLLAKAQSLPSSYQLRYAVLLENDGNVIAARQWYQEYLKQPDQENAARLFAAQRLQQLSNLR